MATKKYQLHLKGYVGGWDFDSDYVDYVVAQNEGKRLDVLIDSLGGYCNTALSIAAAFRRHGDVHVHYSGMNASAATIAGMGAKEVTIDADALWLVHKSSYFIDHFQQANSDDIADLISKMEKQARDLDTLDRVIAALYSARCRKSAEDLASLMADERWLSADEAREWGFVDEVIPVDIPGYSVPQSVLMAMQESGVPVPASFQPSLAERITAAVALVLNKTKSNNISKMKEEINTQVENTIEAPAAAEVETPVEETPQEAAVDAPEEVAEDSRADEIAKLRADLEAARAEIASLKAAPGAESSQVVDAGSVKPASEDNEVVRYASDIADAANIMAMLP